MIAGFVLPLFMSLLSLLFGVETADIVFAGDAMQHQAQIDAGKEKDGTYSYTECFENIKPLISLADYAVVNLETPVSAPPYSGYPCFNAPPAFVDALQDAGFDMMLTANNHTLDRRSRGLKATIEELDRRDIAHLGTYVSAAARDSVLPAIVEVGSFKIGFLNYTYGTNGFTPDGGVVVDYIDRERMRADVEAARSAGAELIAVCIHWGDEYKLLPNRSQRSDADFLESLGVDMIIGSHPHVIQPMELRPNRYYPDKNVFLVYSLGNFISNMKTRDTRGGALAYVRLMRSRNEKPRIVSARYSLVFTLPAGAGGDNFRLVEASGCQEPSMRGRCAEFVKEAKRIFDAHNINVPCAEEGSLMFVD